MKTLPLGQSIGMVLAVTGIGPIAKRCIEKVTGKPCGCEKRSERLDAMGKTIYNAVVPEAKPKTQADKPQGRPVVNAVVPPAKPCGTCGK